MTDVLASPKGDFDARGSGQMDLATRRQRSFRRVALVIIGGLLVAGIAVAVLSELVGSSIGSQGQGNWLNKETRQKIFYDIIAVQDQNSGSNEWNESVKRAAANHYGVPVSTINSIIREGALAGWLQPDPS